MLRIFRGERSAAPAAEQAEERREQTEQQAAARPDDAAPAMQGANGAASEGPPTEEHKPEQPPTSAGDPGSTAAAATGADASPGFLARGRMRRRARFLRAARELAYRDLGGLIFELHRFGQSNDEVVHAKLATLGRIDTELRALEDALHEPQPLTVLRKAGVAACPRCAAIHSSGDRYCPTCGLPVRQDARPIAGAHSHAPATGAQAAGMPTAAQPPPQPPAPPAHIPGQATAHAPGQPQTDAFADPPPARPTPPPGTAGAEAPAQQSGSGPGPGGEADRPTEVVDPAHPAREAQRRSQSGGTEQSTQAFETIPPSGRGEAASARREHERP